MNYRENAPLEEIDLSLYQTENPPSAHYPTHPEHFRTNIVIFARLPQIIFIRTFWKKSRRPLSAQWFF